MQNAIKCHHLVLFLCISMPAHSGQYLGQLTWLEARDAFASTPVVIIPFAAGAKEHGPHLPMNTDQAVMEHLLDAAVRERDVLVAPPILHGWFPAFRDYPGTEVTSESFQNYVADIARSLVKHGAQRVMFLNLGITRATGLPLAIVARDIRADFEVPTLLVSWDDLDTDEVPLEQERGGHADESETSVSLVLQPDLVQMDKASIEYRKPPREQIGYAPGKFDAKSEPGHFGDPTRATVAKGRAILAAMEKNLLLAIDQFAVTPTTPRR